MKRVILATTATLALMTVFASAQQVSNVRQKLGKNVGHLAYWMLSGDGAGTASEDSTGDLLSVDLNTNGVLNHPIFQINREGGINAADYFVVGPASSAPNWRFSQTFNPEQAMMGIISDLGAGPNATSLLVTDDMFHHDLVHFNDFVSWNGVTATMTRRITIQDNGMIRWDNGVVAANLGTPANGTFVYCPDCVQASNPCVSGGTGAFAKRLAGAWDCH